MHPYSLIVHVYHIIRYSIIKLNARGRVFYSSRIPALWHLEDALRFLQKIRYLHLTNLIARFHFT